MFNDVSNILYKRSKVYSGSDRSSKFMLQRWVSMHRGSNGDLTNTLNKTCNNRYSVLSDDEYFKLMYVSTPRQKFEKIKYIKKDKKRERKRKSNEPEVDLGSIFSESNSTIEQSLQEVYME